MIHFGREQVRNVVYGLLSCILLGSGIFFVYKQLNPVVVFISQFPEMWYPRDPQALNQKISLLFKQAHDRHPATIPNRPWLLFVPHAGYDYAGCVAAAGYQTLRGKRGAGVKRVIILSPSHNVDFNGMALPGFTTYQNPLGELTVDMEVIEGLKHTPFTQTDDLTFHREHSVDVQLPWIQTCMPNAKIVPLIVGRLPDVVMTQTLGAALAKFVDDATVVVVSTDMIHYGKRFNFEPFVTSDSVVDDVNTLEESIMQVMTSLNRGQFEAIINQTGATVCGKSVIKIALEIAALGEASTQDGATSLGGRSEAQILAHDTSAALRGLSITTPAEYETVGYAAIAAYVKNAS